jgi:hypothetical protein
MPNLDDADDSEAKGDSLSTVTPVSMPSLHDDENTQSSQEQQVANSQQLEAEQGQAIPMDLEELQQAAAADGQQLKFIVDENGQFLQLDNHILTTDADGNQILVQGTNQEQLQHLLQSVGVDGNQVLVQLQGNGEGIEGDGGATLQFGDGTQGQMILVQNENGESQLIDASMLQTEGGNLVLQQNADGETTLTTADGIPVSVSFSGEGSDGQITLSMAGEDGQQIFLQQPVEDHQGEQDHTEGGEAAMQLEESSQDTAETAEQTATTTAVTEENQLTGLEEKPSEAITAASDSTIINTTTTTMTSEAEVSGEKQTEVPENPEANKTNNDEENMDVDDEPKVEDNEKSEEKVKIIGYILNFFLIFQISFAVSILCGIDFPNSNNNNNNHNSLSIIKLSDEFKVVLFCLLN